MGFAPIRHVKDHERWHKRRDSLSWPWYDVSDQEPFSPLDLLDVIHLLSSSFTDRRLLVCRLGF